MYRPIDDTYHVYLPVENGLVLSLQGGIFLRPLAMGQISLRKSWAIRALVHGVSGNVNGVPIGNGPVVGVLLVAKSLSDVGATMLLLRALLLVSEVATLVVSTPA
jgi:hypothetical protein